MKQCSKCLELKPLNAYYKRAGNKDGYHNVCIACWKAKNKIWYSDNKDNKLTYAKNYRLENPNISSDWRTANPDYEKQWRKNNRIKIRNIENTRRTRIKNNGSFLIRDSFLQNLYNSPCLNCGSNKNITMDHVIPIARGGRHSEGNLQPLCNRCNSSKKNKLMSEWKYR